jgi:hypothetical protein
LDVVVEAALTLDDVDLLVEAALHGAGLTIGAVPGLQGARGIGRFSVRPLALWDWGESEICSSKINRRAAMPRPRTSGRNRPKKNVA